MFTSIFNSGNLILSQPSQLSVETTLDGDGSEQIIIHHHHHNIPHMPSVGAFLGGLDQLQVYSKIYIEEALNMFFSQPGYYGICS